MSPLCLVDSDKSLFAWSDKTVEESRKRDRDQRNKQIVAILYQWELCDSLLMAGEDNVSGSSGLRARDIAG